VHQTNRIAVRESGRVVRRAHVFARIGCAQLILIAVALRLREHESNFQKDNMRTIASRYPRLAISRRICLGTAAVLAAGLVHAQSASGMECVADLDALARYVVENDAGARDQVAQKGHASFDAALAAQRLRAAQAVNDTACIEVLRGYLRTFRRFHLALRALDASGESQGLPPPNPEFKILSENTALIAVPSFADQAGTALAQLLKEHESDIAGRPNLVIDVRGNGGGSDWTYAPLVALAEANIRRELGVLLLATAANSAANRNACDVLAPGSNECRKETQMESEAMDRALAGSMIPQPGDPAIRIIEPVHVARRPNRIGILVDHRCGSSCEEFLLAMRQSFKVKLFGQSSAGSLDYSNLRPWTLPSGRRRLLYATSRSLRLPEFAVDTAGIPPDQVLPTPSNSAQRDGEVSEVQRVLESGR
jgi:hypothetical protein